jgi:hypothetical protein
MRLRLMIVCAVCGLPCIPPAASAATCGVDKDTAGKPLRATLTLDEKSRTTLPFKRNKKQQPYTFIFTLGGCDVAALSPLPKLVIVPTSGDDIGDALVDKTLTTDDVNLNGDTLIVKDKVDPTKIGAGNAAAFAILQAPYLSNNRTPIALNRSETNWFLVGLLGLMASLIGLGWLALQNIDSIGVSIRGRKLIAICIAAIFAGLIVTTKDYLGQEVWTFGDNGLSLGIAAFLAASTGAIAGLIGNAKKPER